MTVLDDGISLVGAGGQVLVIPFGAQVLSWTPSGEDPVLWVSRRADPSGEAPVRGGIPICLPWFGAGPDQTRSPAHGFARTSTWKPLGTEEAGSSRALVLTLDHEPGVDDAFPDPFRAELRVVLGDDLVVTLRVTNRGSRAFDFEEALHTYLAVGDVKDTTVDGLEGCEYLDQVRGDGRWRTQNGEVTFVGETDRVYRCDSTLVVHDPRNRRDIVIDRDSSSNVVVWNPWAEGTRRLGDVAPSDWEHFVCVESANVGQDAVHLDPGATHEMMLVLHVDPMV